MTTSERPTAADSGRGGETGQAVDYFNQGIEHLRAGRLEEAYICANEALHTDSTHQKAATLLNHVLYTLHPKRRRVDMAQRLCDRVLSGMSPLNSDKLFTQLTKWHRSVKDLLGSAIYHQIVRNHAQCYVEACEALAMISDGVSCEQASTFRDKSLIALGFPTPDPHGASHFDNLAATMPIDYHRSNWPRALSVETIRTYPGYAEVKMSDGSDLSPVVPINQLAQFINNHVEGRVDHILLIEELLPMLHANVRPQRFNFRAMSLASCFRQLPWSTVKEIFNSEQMMRTKVFIFRPFQLLPGVAPSAFLTELGAIRQCDDLYIGPAVRGFPECQLPRFPTAALIDWLKWKKVRDLALPLECLADGVQAFVTLLKEDPARGLNYEVAIYSLDVDLSTLVREEALVNDATGDRLFVKVGADPKVTSLVDGRPVSAIRVHRLPPA